MRPVQKTPVHHTGDLAELVCSNSLRGNALDQAAGLLKEEMRRLGSLIVRVADEVKVPAGSALAVDRDLFARRVTEAVTALPGVRAPPRRGAADPRRSRDDRGHGPADLGGPGPRTSPPSWARTHLYFYDAVSPVVEADTIDIGPRLPGLALRQGRRRLRQLPARRGGVPGVLRGAHRRRVRRPPRLREGAVLRGLPAPRGDREPRAGHAALRPDEAGGARATRAPAAGPTRSSSSGRTTSRPATTRWWASRPSSSGESRSGSSA